METVHQQFMAQALALAREAAAAGEVPVGCVIVRDGAVIGRGRNRREEKQSVASHAEMEAMAQANAALGSWRLEGCDLYVTLEPWRSRPGHGRLRRRAEPLYGGLPPPPPTGGRHPGGGLRPSAVRLLQKDAINKKASQISRCAGVNP